MILDIEMPKMDGLTFLRKIMAQRPIPVVICSALTEQRSDVVLEALDAGAIEIIAKPRVDTTHSSWNRALRVCDAVRAAARGKVDKPRVRRTAPVAAKLTADVILPPPRFNGRAPQTDRQDRRASAPPPAARKRCKDVLTALPADSPGIVIVQHMPEKLHRRLRAPHGRPVPDRGAGGQGRRRGPARACPDRARQPPHAAEAHRRAATAYRSRTGPLVSRHRPSVDVLFRSAAQYAGANAVGIIMTGMGDDGAKRHARDAERRRPYDRPERGDLRGLRHAAHGHRSRRGTENSSA